MSKSAEISGRLGRGVRRAASRSRHFLDDCWMMNWDRLVVDRDMVDWCCMVVDGKVVGSKVGVVGCGVGGHIVGRLQSGQLMHLECGECKERLLFIVFCCDLLHISALSEMHWVLHSLWPCNFHWTGVMQPSAFGKSLGPVVGTQPPSSGNLCHRECKT